jgi:hypothetical protein
MTEPIKPEVLPPIAPHSKTVAEQEADFTSEGAPAPGKVGIATPVCAQVCRETSDFVEGREDPNQSRELERQQDA